jgi:Zn-finger nucleic acid-binding protein
MICPRCQSAELAELDRDGVTIDRCSACRGIWLDRGELEKLLSRARPHGHDRDDDSDDRHRPARKRSWWDIFDD